ncbi:hypothetical protein [Mesorhizobium sp. ORM16]|uniref:hypothetical protein n=1 Tax=Mesorhizobium sp. ORM16 TaxID=3376989 RepID=UPI003857B5BA
MAILLAIDVDPQASLSAIFGARSGKWSVQNETIHAAYGATSVPISEINRPPVLTGIDLIPGNIERRFERHFGERFRFAKS